MQKTGPLPLKTLCNCVTAYKSLQLNWLEGSRSLGSALSPRILVQRNPIMRNA